MAKDRKNNINLYNIRYKDSLEPIDWQYYTKFYPDKQNAIWTLKYQTGLKTKEAEEIVEEIFSRVEEGKVERGVDNTRYNRATYDRYEQMRKEENNNKQGFKKAGSAVGKGIGCGCFTIIYIIFGTIFSLTGKYSKKRR